MKNYCFVRTLEQAAKNCQKFLHTSDEWEMEAAAFIEKRAIKGTVRIKNEDSNYIHVVRYDSNRSRF